MRPSMLLAAALAALAPLSPFAQDAAATPPPAADQGPAVAAPAVPPAALPPVAPPAAYPPPGIPSPAVAPMAPAKPVRSGPYVGFSFGTGRGDVYAGGTTTAVNDLIPGVSPTTYALMLRAGWANGDLLWGMQLNLVRSQWDTSGGSAAMQLTGVDLVLTWMPQDLGMFVRAGLGPASLSFDSGGSTSDSWGGAEIMMGIGIASGGFGVAIDYVRQTYDDGAPFDGAGYLLATLSLDLG